MNIRGAAAERLGVYMGSLDVKTAFDVAQPKMVEKILKYMKGQGKTTAAIMSEMVCIKQCKSELRYSRMHPTRERGGCCLVGEDGRAFVRGDWSKGVRQHDGTRFSGKEVKECRLSFHGLGGQVLAIFKQQRTIEAHDE